MKYLKQLFAFAALLLLLPLAISADSPLTSTPFSDAYMDHKIVAYAKDAGTVDKKIAKYLMNPSKPIAVKAAIVNALGWSTEGKNNASLFTKYLVEKYGAVQTMKDNASSAELMCLGYMAALDDYFHPQNGAEYLALAEKRDPSSFTVRLIHALVRSQIAFDTDWCQVYTIVNDVVEAPGRCNDFSEDALPLITEYIDLYREECK